MSLSINPNPGPIITPPIGPPAPITKTDTQTSIPQESIEGNEQTITDTPENSESLNQTQAVQNASFNPLGFEIIEKAKEVGAQAKEALGNIASETFINSAKRSAKAGNHENAVKILEKLLESDPNNSEALYLLGNANRNLGDNDKALALYDNSLTTDPKNARAMVNKGALIAEQGNNEEALQLYTQAVEIMTENDDPYTSLAINNVGMANKELGNTEEAAKHFAKAASAGSERAMENLEILLEDNPDNSSVNYQMGNVQRRAGDTDKAIESYDKSLTLDPENARAMVNKGALIAEQGNNEEALQLYTQAVDIMTENDDPYTSLAINNVGMANKELGNTEEAAKHFAKAASAGSERAMGNLEILLEDNPDNSSVNYQMGNVQRRAGDVDKAIESYDKSLTLDPENARAMVNKGVLIAEQGNNEEALQLYTQAVEIMTENDDPYTSLAINNVGMANQELGNIEEAAKNFAQAASDGSERAVENLKLLLEANPDNAALKNLMETAKP